MGDDAFRVAHMDPCAGADAGATLYVAEPRCAGPFWTGGRSMSMMSWHEIDTEFPDAGPLSQQTGFGPFLPLRCYERSFDWGDCDSSNEKFGRSQTNRSACSKPSPIKR